MDPKPVMLPAWRLKKDRVHRRLQRATLIDTRPGTSSIVHENTRASMTQPDNKPSVAIGLHTRKITGYAAGGQNLVRLQQRLYPWAEEDDAQLDAFLAELGAIR